MTLVPFIVTELLKLLKESKSLRVKTAVMRTLAQVAHVLAPYLGPQFGNMLPEFQKIMNDSTAYEHILDTLSILRKLFKSGDENAHFY